ISLHLGCAGEQQALSLERAAASTFTLDGERLQVDDNGLRRQHQAIRRGDTLYLRWDGELHAVTAYDPIAEAEAGHGHQGGLT
ncbi:3-methylcrotonyl-CoA carboxylase, partial [Pseudomonas sp. SIMBA_064]